MEKILVIGASGLVGRRLVKTLLTDGYAVRCLARHPAKVQDLAALGCEVVEGDISDPDAVRRAVDGVQAIYISIHTLSPQPGSGANARFMAVEIDGLQNVIVACRSGGVRRVIYVTSIGISPDEPSEWLRERWRAEQRLLSSGLEVTVIRPGMIVGAGGHGFDAVAANAKRRVAVVMGGDRPKFRTIALDDLVYYLCGVRDDPRTYGQWYEVGNDDVLSIKQLIDATADMLGRPHPVKIELPLGVMGALAPAIEAVAKLPKGAFKGLIDGMKVDAIGDPASIRAILPRPLLTYRQAAARAMDLADS